MNPIQPLWKKIGLARTDRVWDRVIKIFKIKNLPKIGRF